MGINKRNLFFACGHEKCLVSPTYLCLPICRNWGNYPVGLPGILQVDTPRSLTAVLPGRGCWGETSMLPQDGFFSFSAAYRNCGFPKQGGDCYGCGRVFLRGCLKRPSCQTLRRAGLPGVRDVCATTIDRATRTVRC